MKTLARLLLLQLLTAATAPAMAAEPLVDEVALEGIRVVMDADGFSHLRSGPSTRAPILAKIPSGSPVVVEPELKEGWARLAPSEADEAEGFLHSSRLLPVTSWRRFGPDRSSDHESVLKAGKFSVKVAAVPFRPAEHKITRDTEGFVLVDGLAPWGQDGGVPNQSLFLSVTFAGTEIQLPAEATTSLFEPRPETLVLLTPDSSGDRAVVVMTNSDGAGAYVVAWGFEGGRYRGRSVHVPF